MEYTLPPKPQKKLRIRIRNWAIAVALVIIYVWTFTKIGRAIEWNSLFSTMVDNFSRVIPKLLQPDLSTFGKIMEKMMETLFIAYAGTLIAAVLAVPFSFLAAKNMVSNRYLTTIVKWVLDAIRAFPELILALIFVASIGPGAFAGVLAIGISAIGMLGKLYSEVIEGIDMSVIETMQASGANRLQILFYAVLPQVIPEFMSYFLYRFEVDIRASTILGIIGAGGIGTMIVISVANRNWNEVGAILLVIIVTVTIIDYISGAIRKRLV